MPAVSETTKLWQLLSDFVEFRSEDDPADPFQMYRSLSYGGLSLYLKAGGYSFTEMNYMDRKKVFKAEKMFPREPKLSDFIFKKFSKFIFTQDFSAEKHYFSSKMLVEYSPMFEGGSHQ